MEVSGLLTVERAGFQRNVGAFDLDLVDVDHLLDLAFEIEEGPDHLPDALLGGLLKLRL